MLETRILYADHSSRHVFDAFTDLWQEKTDECLQWVITVIQLSWQEGAKLVLNLNDMQIIFLNSNNHFFVFDGACQAWQQCTKAMRIKKSCWWVKPLLHILADISFTKELESRDVSRTDGLNKVSYPFQVSEKDASCSVYLLGNEAWSETCPAVRQKAEAVPCFKRLLEERSGLASWIIPYSAPSVRNVQKEPKV